MSEKQEGMYLSHRVLFITVLVSICINIFFLTLGILIGKEDLNWQQENPTIAEEVIDDPPIRTSIDDELAEFETPSTTEPETSVAERAPEPLPDTPPVQPEPRPAMADLQPEDPPKPKPEPVTTPPVQKPKPESTKPAQTSLTAGFWIQVLASKDRAQASKMQSRLQQKGYPATMIQEGGFYKVQAGPYATRSSADQAKTGIKRDFKVDGWVRSR